MSLGKAFASTVAQTPGDNELHSDASQDVDSTDSTADSSRAPQAQLPLVEMQLKVQPWCREILQPSCHALVSPLPFEAPAGAWISDNGAEQWGKDPWSCYSLIPAGERLNWHSKAGARQNTCGGEMLMCLTSTLPKSCCVAQEPLQELRRMEMMVLTPPELRSNQTTEQRSFEHSRP